MTTKIRKLSFLTILYFVFVAIPPKLSRGQQVPCIFFMGDSLLDNGNNNNLKTRSRADYYPYGVDYPDGPTGRFSNGENMADFLAKFLGFNKSVPPFATANGKEILAGVNYASGAAGILAQSGSNLGSRLSMDMQLLNHKLTILRTAVLLGNSTHASDHLKKCLYVVNIGSNDYLNNYLLPRYHLSTTPYSPNKFAQLLIDVYKKQLKGLYKDGARKICVFGLGLLGCLPQVVSSMQNSRNHGCVDSINDMAHQFNKRLKPLIDTLNADLDDARFIMINSTGIATTGDLSSSGIKIKNASCCVANEIGLCAKGKKPCNNRKDYYFWDKVHPTETANRAMATRAYSAALPTDAYPVDIRTLVRQ